jgi:DhnA family fructose-bisphosphate aldolase class Ia
MNQSNPLEAPTPSRNRAAASEQDKAAGGAQFRKLRIQTGEVVTASLALSVSAASAYAVLRFKHEKQTFRQTVGRLKKAASRHEMLTVAWRLVREQKAIEKNGWSWVVPIP